MAAATLSCPDQATSNRHRSVSQCTHVRMTRLYDRYDCQRCMTCNRVPDFGYLYRCTQDSDGNLPISEFVDEEMAVDLADLKIRCQSSSSYTSYSNFSGSSSNKTNTFSTNTLSNTGENHDADMASDEVLAQTLEGKRKFETAFPSEPVQMPTNCNLKICPACRPIFKERAWQSLNHVVGNQAIPPQHEMENRRVSDAATIINIKPACKVAKVVLDTTSSWQRRRQQTGDLSYSPAGKTSVRYLTSTQSHKLDDCASDADDENGFAKEDESDNSSTDLDFPSETHSEADEAPLTFNPYEPVRQPVSNQHILKPSRLDKTCPSLHFETMPAEHHEIASRPTLIRRARIDTMTDRMYEGRFQLG